MATAKYVRGDEHDVGWATERVAMTPPADLLIPHPWEARRRVPPKSLPLAVAGLDLVAKLLLVAFLILSVADPSWGHLDGKAPLARALTYPLFAFVVPIGWLLRRRRGTYPWLVDLMVTTTCFTDILGNRLDLYDSIVWFDDWMHFMNTGLLSAAVVMLTMSARATTVAVIVERAVASGMTMALAWEGFEYVSFMTRSTELPTAYADTVVDLTLGWLGSVVAGLVISVAWSRAGGREGVEATDIPKSVAG